MKRSYYWTLAWLLSWVGYVARRLPDPLADKISWVAMLPGRIDGWYCRYARAGGFKETW